MMPQLPLQTYVALDTETTGIGEEDRIIDLYAVIVDPISGQTGESLSIRCNPGRPSHPRALEKHRITEEDVQSAPPFQAYAEELLRFLSGHRIIAHNAQFDMRMLRQEFARLDPASKRRAKFMSSCSMLAAQEILGVKRWPSLDFLCDHFAINRSARTEKHAAELDVRLLTQILPKLKDAYDRALGTPLTAESTGLRSLGEHSDAIFGRLVQSSVHS